MRKHEGLLNKKLLKERGLIINIKSTFLNCCNHHLEHCYHSFSHVLPLLPF